MPPHSFITTALPRLILSSIFYLLLSSCSTFQPQTELVISRSEYANKLHGFWLGQCIANWTGLVTEMDKIGGTGPHGEFYTRDDWGKSDQASIWGEGIPSNLSTTIDFVFENPEGIWGSDDDTDIEYIYQHLLAKHQTTRLTPQHIQQGWLAHIYDDSNTPFVNNEGKPENFLWVSNQQAFDLMRNKNMLPPDTSAPENNPHYAMIDAQLTTEIFGLYAPGAPNTALAMAHLPIRTTAHKNAAWAAEFYVVMYSLAATVNTQQPIGPQLRNNADIARTYLPDSSYTAKMYDYVKLRYQQGAKWETVRDELYQRYQVEQADGYNISSQNLYCNGCFASGINFAASIVSLLYGDGDFKQTIKIATLAGWDSDNPAATWGGMLGFILGKDGVERAFNRTFSEVFNIHRTRGGFTNQGLDTFTRMAEEGISIVDRVVVEELHGKIDLTNNLYFIPRVNIQQP